ncbi:hypothetical protein [Caldalkalibacillus mannanilyticus]|uniref:hypothetical protein n=1 Tax=Caldalkalibacillus mannanilyticus TaxID=1418 RepID=UPI0004686951|nr:hypothetical protein [Caldalkalibacillus mannanilyticus]
MEIKKILVVLVCLSFAFSVSLPISAQDENTLNIQLDILENEGLVEVVSIPYGGTAKEVGFIESGEEILAEGPTSFFVRNNKIYILDNVNKKILIKSGNNLDMIQLDELYWGTDLYVCKDGTMYVLDIGSDTVLSYDSKGNLIEKSSIPDVIEIPTGLDMDFNNNIIVRQSTDVAVSLNNGVKINKGRHLENTLERIDVSIVNQKEGQIILHGDKDKKIIDIPFEHTFGEIIVRGVVGNQIVFEKTEVSDTHKIMVESFIQVVNKKGELTGAARMPLEKMKFIPNHMVRVENNKIYLLSPESDSLKVYEVLVGKKYEKTLDKRVSEYHSSGEYQKDKKNEVVDIKDLDSNLKSSDLVENGHIYRSEVSSRANQMINHKWKVNKGNKEIYGKTQLPKYIVDAKVGDEVTGIPYMWGGADGIDTYTWDKSGGDKDWRGLFPNLQGNGRQAGNVSSANYSPRPTGIDCSGFVQIAWFRTDTKKLSTWHIPEISTKIEKSSLKLMDALNKAGDHVVLYRTLSSETVYTKEATPAGKGSTQDYNRTWKSMDSYSAYKYSRILEDNQQRPIK